MRTYWKWTARDPFGRERSGWVRAASRAEALEAVTAAERPTADLVLSAEPGAPPSRWAGLALAGALALAMASC